LEIEDIVSEQVRLKATTTVKKVMQNLESAGRTPAIMQLDNTRIVKMVQDLLESLLINKHVMLNLMDIKALDDYTFSHSVNVCVLTLLTGASLMYNLTDLNILGTSSILHDIGR
jgi:HD-GYP domain-containing protein (c-di-GMP phosphodiesterase class II)